MQKVRNTFFITLGVTLFFFLPRVSGAQDRSLNDRIQNGNFLFAARGCSTCHSVKGEGGKTGPDLTHAMVWASPILGAAVMWNHVPLMAKSAQKERIQWPDLKAEEVGDIFTYLRSLNPKAPSTHVFAGDILQGQARFEGTCQKCHGAPYKGGKTGPDLGAIAKKLRTKEEFATRMIRHAPQMLPLATSMDIPWPQLTGTEMSSLFLYLRSLKAPKK